MIPRVHNSLESINFAQQIGLHNTVNEVVDATVRITGQFGIETLAFSILPNEQQRFADTLLARKWPAEWFSEYTDNNYIRVDPVAHALKSTATRPFRWSDISMDKATHEGAALMHRRRDFGFNDAIVIPVHNPRGLPAFVSMSGRQIEVPAAELVSLHVVALAAFERIRELQKLPCTSKSKLTPREREVLTWVAHGKCAWEIGIILNIAKRTVDEHVQTATKKIGATNRAHAVAIAIKDRHIMA